MRWGLYSCDVYLEGRSRCELDVGEMVRASSGSESDIGSGGTISGGSTTREHDFENTTTKDEREVNWN